MHELACAKRLETAGPQLRRYEDRLIRFIADGHEVIPEAISPRLVLVRRHSEHELLFRYASLHWKIPVSAW